MGEPTEGQNSSIISPEQTSRAEKAAQTQKELREIAQQGTWQPPETEEAPKADGAGGLQEGTPLASRDSLTPGQQERARHFERQADDYQRSPDSYPHDTSDAGLSRARGIAAQDVRRGIEDNADSRRGVWVQTEDGHTVESLPVAEEKAALARNLNETYRQAREEARSGVDTANLDAYYDRLDEATERVLGDKLESRYGPDDVPGRSGSERLESVQAAAVGDHEAQALRRDNIGNERLNDSIDRVHERTKYSSAVHSAEDLYSLAPDKYAQMPAEKFLEEMKAFEADNRELKNMEDQLKLVEDLRRIASEGLNGGGGQKEVVIIEARAPSLKRGEHEAHNEYFARVEAAATRYIASKSEGIKVLRENMAKRYESGEQDNKTQ